MGKERLDSGASAASGAGSISLRGSRKLDILGESNDGKWFDASAIMSSSEYKWGLKADGIAPNMYWIGELSHDPNVTMSGGLPTPCSDPASPHFFAIANPDGTWQGDTTKTCFWITGTKSGAVPADTPVGSVHIPSYYFGEFTSPQKAVALKHPSPLTLTYAFPEGVGIPGDCQVRFPESLQKTTIGVLDAIQRRHRLRFAPATDDASANLKFALCKSYDDGPLIAGMANLPYSGKDSVDITIKASKHPFPPRVLEVLAHETGHGLGFDHVSTLDQCTTIMNPGHSPVGNIDSISRRLPNGAIPLGPHDHFMLDTMYGGPNPAYNGTLEYKEADRRVWYPEGCDIWTAFGGSMPAIAQISLGAAAGAAVGCYFRRRFDEKTGYSQSPVIGMATDGAAMGTAFVAPWAKIAFDASKALVELKSRGELPEGKQDVIDVCSAGSGNFCFVIAAHGSALLLNEMVSYYGGPLAPYVLHGIVAAGAGISVVNTPSYHILCPPRHPAEEVREAEESRETEPASGAGEDIEAGRVRDVERDAGSEHEEEERTTCGVASACVQVTAMSLLNGMPVIRHLPALLCGSPTQEEVHEEEPQAVAASNPTPHRLQTEEYRPQPSSSNPLQLYRAAARVPYPRHRAGGEPVVAAAPPRLAAPTSRRLPPATLRGAEATMMETRERKTATHR